jgi:hypothetical protein
MYDRLVNIIIWLLGICVAKAAKPYNSLTTPDRYVEIAIFLDKWDSIKKSRRNP